MSASQINATFVQSLPKEILEAFPAAQPPPGVEANFANPPSIVPQILGVSYTFLVFALLTFALRIWTRVCISRKWQWDDVTISLGFLCALMYNGFVTAAAIDGPIGKHLWDVHADVLLRRSDTLQNVATTILITPALGLIKSSFFIQFYILFKTLRWIRIGVWIGAVISVLFYVAVSISALVLTIPRPGHTLFETILSQRYQKMAAFSIPTGVVGMLVDWYLLLLPIPAVLGLAMSKAKKLGILLIFMTGAVAAVSSIVTLYYRVKLQTDPSDQTWKVGYVYIWAQVEMFAGVTASNMPTVKQFYVHQRPHLETIRARLGQMLCWGVPAKRVDSHEDSAYRTIIRPDTSSTQNQSIAGRSGLDRTQYSMEKPFYEHESQIQVTHEVDVRSMDHSTLSSIPSAIKDHSWLDLEGR